MDDECGGRDAGQRLLLSGDRYRRRVTGAAQPLGDGAIDLEKLQALLAFGSELDDLDYKEFLDLGHQKDKVELVKDLAAMQSNPDRRLCRRRGRRVGQTI